MEFESRISSVAGVLPDRMILLWVPRLMIRPRQWTEKACGRQCSGCGYGIAVSACSTLIHLKEIAENRHRGLDAMSNAPNALGCLQAMSSANHNQPKTYLVRYFAVLRERVGCARESVTSAARTPGELFVELAARHGLQWRPELLRAVVNERYVEMDTPLRDGDRVVFVPPVAGG